MGLDSNGTVRFPGHASKELRRTIRVYDRAVAEPEEFASMALGVVRSGTSVADATTEFFQSLAAMLTTLDADRRRYAAAEQELLRTKIDNELLRAQLHVEHQLRKRTQDKLEALVAGTEARVGTARSLDPGPAPSPPAPPPPKALATPATPAEHPTPDDAVTQHPTPARSGRRRGLALRLLLYVVLLGVVVAGGIGVGLLVDRLIR